MQELTYNSMGLEALFNSESSKCRGILNGIDTVVWDPKNDKYLNVSLKDDITSFKNESKKELLKLTRFDPNLPIVAFIGRFASEKGADLMPSIIRACFRQNLPINFFILGTGEKHVEHELGMLAYHRPDRVAAHITYNEALSHIIYAGSDFLIMPSRVEPCGLNQMYAMRYGTIPIVHNIGGLKDSVQYFDGDNGTGLKFNALNLHDILQELHKSIYLFGKTELFQKIRANAMSKDFSWTTSAKEYFELYKSLL